MLCKNKLFQHNPQPASPVVLFPVKTAVHYALACRNLNTLSKNFWDNSGIVCWLYAAFCCEMREPVFVFELHYTMCKNLGHSGTASASSQQQPMPNIAYDQEVSDARAYFKSISAIQMICKLPGTKIWSFLTIFCQGHNSLHSFLPTLQCKHMRKYATHTRAPTTNLMGPLEIQSRQLKVTNLFALMAPPEPNADDFSRQNSGSVNNCCVTALPFLAEGLQESMSDTCCSRTGVATTLNWM